ncbi:hypothetical protein FQA39_LY06881 [Lamprigera yunnana]|nr:hypothetical protein FQA39_LY06881 [Lamprigera yunnana]
MMLVTGKIPIQEHQNQNITRSKLVTATKELQPNATSKLVTAATQIQRPVLTDAMGGSSSKGVTIVQNSNGDANASMTTSYILQIAVVVLLAAIVLCKTLKDLYNFHNNKVQKAVQKSQLFTSLEAYLFQIDDQDIKLHLESNSSMESSGPPDSHEAMNNRDLSSKQSKSNREKRSYEFLMGLVNNNSRFEVTNVDLPNPNERKKSQMSKNKALLELMVKIAADPEQWDKVHRLLQKIDNDLMTSRKLFNSIQNSIEDINNFSSISRLAKIDNLTKSEVTINTSTSLLNNTKIASELKELSDNPKYNNNELQKMVVILNEKKQKPTVNREDEALKSNRWPDSQTEGKIVYKPNQDLDRQSFENSKYSWQSDSEGKTYPRNFAYHRVTGNPLYHTNFDKAPKAYIAVSVIAPKPLHSRTQEEDLILENELRQLKPWTTNKQNYKNAAAVNPRWIVPSENNNNIIAP